MEATSGPCRVGRLSVGTLWVCCKPTACLHCEISLLCVGSPQPTHSAGPYVSYFTSALGPTVGSLLWLYTTSKQTYILGIINGFLHKFHRKLFCFCGNSKLLCSCGFIYVWVALNLTAVQSASNTYYSTCRVEYFFSHSSPKTMNNSVILFKCHLVFPHQFFFNQRKSFYVWSKKKAADVFLFRFFETNH